MRDLPWLWERCERDIETGCWLWSRSLNAYGYGVAGAGASAHRIAYELLVGPIPEGLHIDHLCRVRHCVNPAHMEPVTREENTARGRSFAALNAAKTHCLRGHEFTPENTMIRPDGHRRCRTCQRVWERRRQGRRAAATTSP